MARPEPFRALIEKALQAEPVPPLRVVERVESPAPVLDDEHKSITLEQRLDAAILAGGAPPARGLRAPAPRTPRADVVPLRLESPFSRAKTTEMPLPVPRVLQFLPDDIRPELTGNTDDSLTRMPRLEPVVDSARLPIAVGVHTNVYRLRSAEDEMTPARPLPAVTLEGLFDLERKSSSSKVVTRDELHDSGIRVRTFSSDDFDDVDDDDDTRLFDDPDTEERTGRSAAAIALPALSEEDSLAPVDDDFGDLDDLDELARQLGLAGKPVVRLSTPSTLPKDEPLAAGDVDAVVPQDVEIVAVASNTDPFGAVIMGRMIADALAPAPALADGDDDDLEAIAADDVQEITAGGTAKHVSLLPQAVLEKIETNSRKAVVVDDDAYAAAFDNDDDDDDDGDAVASAEDAAVADDLDVTAPRRAAPARAPVATDVISDDEVTPARGLRPALEAPSAVRFVVADAPARPRTAALSPDEKERNKQRARELYLVAMDDLGDKDTEGAIVHLELALAYDDETSLYGDLLQQLKKRI